MDPHPRHLHSSARSWQLFAGYCIVTFAWTWGIWWGGVIARLYSFEISPGLVVFLGGPGPLFGALYVLRGADRTYQHDFLRRLFDPSRIAGSWWLAMGAVAILPAFVGYLVVAAAGRPPALDVAVSLGTVAFVIGFAFAAGLVEEPGWRGVGPDLLQSRVGPLPGAAILAILWVLWHLPLFFLEGTYQHALGFLTVRFWFFNISLALLSVLYVWLRNGSRGSILIAVVAHAGTNIAGMLIPQDARTDVIRSIVLLVGVIAVLWLTRGDLHHRQEAGLRSFP
jgi:uncharacterized protein